MMLQEFTNDLKTGRELLSELAAALIVAFLAFFLAAYAVLKARDDRRRDKEEHRFAGAFSRSMVREPRDRSGKVEETSGPKEQEQQRQD
jgi:hypothetical protein